MSSFARLSIAAAVAFCAALLQAMPEIPLQSAKALGYARGRKIRTGLVFIDGKYISPPYVVERWGTGLKINNIPVTGQIIDWLEFLKTQESFKTVAVKAESKPAEPEAGGSLDDLFEDDGDDGGESSLDDLFDDDPAPKKAKKKPKESRPAPEVSYEFSGEFVANEASKKLLARINTLRTDIDKHLRGGGFVCFGDSYSRVLGDSRTALQLLERLPPLMRRCENAQAFASAVRAAGMVYFPDELYRDFFENRLDYRKLDKRCKKWKKDAEWEKVLKESGTPLF